MKNVLAGKMGKVIKIGAVVVIGLVLVGAGAYALSSMSYEKGMQTAAEYNSIHKSGYEDEYEYDERSSAKSNNENHMTKSSGAAAADIGLDKAKTIALKQVKGAKEADIVKAHGEYDDGILEYEVKIRYEDYEYDFGIRGTDGKIIESEVEIIDCFETF